MNNNYYPLISLIEEIFEKESDINQIKEKVLIALKAYYLEKSKNSFPPILPSNITDLVPYGSICSCNPANGGSGICGCVIANKLVPNPAHSNKQYHVTNTTTYNNETIKSYEYYKK
jgi:hypothetical protein